MIKVIMGFKFMRGIYLVALFSTLAGVSHASCSKSDLDRAYGEIAQSFVPIYRVGMESDGFSERSQTYVDTAFSRMPSYSQYSVEAVNGSEDEAFFRSINQQEKRIKAVNKVTAKLRGCAGRLNESRACMVSIDDKHSLEALSRFYEVEKTCSDALYSYRNSCGSKLKKYSLNKRFGSKKSKSFWGKVSSGSGSKGEFNPRFSSSLLKAVGDMSYYDMCQYLVKSSKGTKVYIQEKRVEWFEGSQEAYQEANHRIAQRRVALRTPKVSSHAGAGDKEGSDDTYWADKAVALKAGEKPVISGRDTLLKFEKRNMLKIIRNPKLRADKQKYTWLLTVESVDNDNVIRASAPLDITEAGVLIMAADEIDPGQRFVFLRAKESDIQKLSIGMEIAVVGTYISNSKYQLTDGSSHTAPVIKVDHLEKAGY